MRVRETINTFRGHRVPRVDFIGRKKVWFLLSGSLIALSLIGLFARGLNFSIAFTGGALLTFPNRSDASVGEYQAVMARFGLAEARVELLGGSEVSIRTESLTTEGGPEPTPSPSPTTSPTANPAESPSPTPSPTESPAPTTSPGETGATPTPAGTASPNTPTPSPAPGPRGEEAERVDRLRQALAETAGIRPEEISEQDVGPTWGQRISDKAIQGLVVFLILVTLYITFRFEWKMAVGAIASLWHDLIITAGVYALVGREVTPETIIALLTILGYSLYDTVVIYDKIKENTESTALVSREGYSGVVNLSLNQVLMRSVNTSLSTMLPIGALLLFGGQTLKDFAFALLVGVTLGGYSSIFVGSPILAILKEREPKYRQLRARAAARAARPALRSVPAEEAGLPDPELEPAGLVVRPGQPEGRPRPRPSQRKKRPRTQKPKRRRR